MIINGRAAGPRQSTRTLSVCDCVTEISRFQFPCRFHVAVDAHDNGAGKERGNRKSAKEKYSLIFIVDDSPSHYTASHPNPENSNSMMDVNLTSQNSSGWNSSSSPWRRYWVQVAAATTTKKKKNKKKFIEVHSIILLNLIIWFRLTFLSSSFAVAVFGCQCAVAHSVWVRTSKEWKQTSL